MHVWTPEKVSCTFSKRKTETVSRQEYLTEVFHHLHNIHREGKNENIHTSPQSDCVSDEI